MSIHGLNHVNIMAPEPLLSEVRAFYLEVLELNEGYRPDFGIGGHWLYCGEQAVIHLIDSSSFADPDNDHRAHPYLDHVAFTCTDVEATEQRLRELGYEPKRLNMEQFGMVQLFLHDPAGLGVELNFQLTDAA